MKIVICACGSKTTVTIRFDEKHVITERVCFNCGKVTRVRFAPKQKEVKQ